jgi:hypothetical protein
MRSTYNTPGKLSTSSDLADLSSQYVGERDSLLFDLKYYYHVPSDPRYKICRSIFEWAFPHHSYEEVRKSRPLNPGLLMDLRTDGASCLTMSHVVPATQNSWVRVFIVISLVMYVDQCCVS